MPLRLLEPVDGRDVRMIQRGERLRFALEPREALRIVREGVGRILIATARSSFVSRARWTSPIPPAPIADWISHEPRRAPIVSGMGQLSNVISSRRHEALPDSSDQFWTTTIPVRVSGASPLIIKNRWPSAVTSYDRVRVASSEKPRQRRSRDTANHQTVGKAR